MGDIEGQHVIGDEPRSERPQIHEAAIRQPGATSNTHGTVTSAVTSPAPIQAHP